MTSSAEIREGPREEVLVVIVNYNGGALLTRAVDAMRQQDFSNYRLVVVDNASTDDSIAQMQSGHPGTEVLHPGKNLGFAAANNLAVRTYLNSRWIALLNPDAFPEPAWLRTLVNAARSNPDVAAFASRTVDARNRLILDGAGDAYHWSGRYWRRGYGLPGAGRYLCPEEIFSACAAAALYTRRAWEDMGGLDEDFFCYGEDVDLGFRLQLAGHRCLYVPGAVAYHQGSALTGERSAFSTYHGQRNLVWVYFKNMPPLLFWPLLPYHLVLNLAALISCVLRGQGRVAFKAKFDALRGLTRTWRKRRSIQRTRRVSAARIWSLLEHGWPGPRC
jgi:GT2 family glycosyltransferase